MHHDMIIALSWPSLILMVTGIYMAASGLGGMIRPDRWHHIIAELDASPTLTFYGGIIALLLGALITVAGSGHWLCWFGVAATIKGVVLLINPPGIFSFYRRVITPNNGRLVSLILVVVGLALIIIPIWRF